MHEMITGLIKDRMKGRLTMMSMQLSMTIADREWGVSFERVTSLKKLKLKTTLRIWG